MELEEAMFKRRSIRNFRGTPVEDEKIETLLRYGMSGPSAGNRRPWEFYVVTNEEILEQLRHSAYFVDLNAPLAIVVAGNREVALPKKMGEYWIQDCSAAMENLLLGAVSLELGACWCGIFPENRPTAKVSKILGLPEHIIPLGICYIGYPDEDKEERETFSPEKVHYFN